MGPGGRSDGMYVKIKRGLDVPLAGAPQQRIEQANAVSSVGVLGRDYPELRPRLQVAVGDRVKLGQTLFTDANRASVRVTAPAAGTVTEITRRARRALGVIKIEIDGDAEETFTAFPGAATLDRAQVREQLLVSGLWTALRARPFSKIPDPESEPYAIFVTAMDTAPLAARPEHIIAESVTEFEHGLLVLTQLTAGKVHVCRAPGAAIPQPDHARIETHEFAGSHPAGLVGTHIHHLAPVGPKRSVWHLGYQDVIAIGHLFAHGRLNPARVISLAGPMVMNPRLLRTRLGASSEELVAGELNSGQCRVISGSVLGGRQAAGWGAYLGRYHQQLAVLPDAPQREFLGWLAPGSNKFSAANVLLSSIFKKRAYWMTTAQNGSPRAMVPIGAYERVLPIDTLATQLLRALLVRDIDTAQGLGALELDEEDVALCSFVCPSKYDYGPVLRETLQLIEKEI